VEIEPQIIAEYIKTGKARLVYRHLLQLGEGSQVLAEASECAGAQGAFWEMRELLYKRQADLYGAADFAAVEPLVAELGLDGPQFQQCMEQHQFQQQVLDDYAAAQREGVSSRPVMDINGTRIIGAQPFARYQQAADAVR
jgi:protein-disulfide isomerase